MPPAKEKKKTGEKEKKNHESSCKKSKSPKVKIEKFESETEDFKTEVVKTEIKKEAVESETEDFKTEEVKTKTKTKAKTKTKTKVKMEEVESETEDFQTEEVKPKAKTKAKTKKKDPNAPKKPLSAYFLFSQEERLKVKNEHPNYSICEVAKELGERWANLAPEVKQCYQQMAEEGRQKYNQDMAKADAETYEAAHGKRRFLRGKRQLPPAQGGKSKKSKTKKQLEEPPAPKSFPPAVPALPRNYGTDGGYDRVYKFSDELAEIVGKKEADRKQLRVLLWAYIKSNCKKVSPDGYFDPDEKMAKVFGKERLGGYAMQKCLQPHLSPLRILTLWPSELWPPSPYDETEEVKFSKELAEIVGKKEANRGQLRMRLWAYIKEKELHDVDGYFTPDEKMAKVFGKEQVGGLAMQKLLQPHLSPQRIFWPPGLWPPEKIKKVTKTENLESDDPEKIEKVTKTKNLESDDPEKIEKKKKKKKKKSSKKSTEKVTKTKNLESDGLENVK